MIDFQKYKSLEFTWEEFENDFLPRLLQVKASMVLYRKGQLLATNDYFLEEFAYKGKSLEEIDVSLWHDQKERERFLELMNSAFNRYKVEKVVSHFVGEIRIFPPGTC